MNELVTRLWASLNCQHLTWGNSHCLIKYRSTPGLHSTFLIHSNIGVPLPHIPPYMPPLHVPLSHTPPLYAMSSYTTLMYIIHSFTTLIYNSLICHSLIMVSYNSTVYRSHIPCSHIPPILGTGK